MARRFVLYRGGIIELNYAVIGNWQSFTMVFFLALVRIDSISGVGSKDNGRRYALF